MRKRQYLQLDLQMFDGEGGAPSGAQDGAAAGVGSAGGAGTDRTVSAAGRQRAGNPLANVRYGIQEEDTRSDAGTGKTSQTESDTPEGRTSGKAGSAGGDTAKAAEAGDAQGEGESFDSLIRGRYKADFDSAVQNIINQRFRETKALERELKSLKAERDQFSPMLTVLADRYGKDAKDTKGILEAMQADDMIYEERAAERGMSVDQYREYTRVMNENRMLKAARDEAEQRQRIAEIHRQWEASAAKVKEQFPNMDYRTEINDPDMRALLGAGIDFETAYQVRHRDEINRGLLEYASKKTERDVVNRIQSRASRPAENGTRSHSQGEVKTHVRDFTDADMEEIQRRVRRGERIVL